MKKIIATLSLLFTSVLMSGCLAPAQTAAEGAEGQQGGGWTTILMYGGIMVLFFGAMYFIAIRPEKKREKEQKALLSTMTVGDTVLTTSGFYGVVIDITNDTVIVEFGNNKNCRIPMQKAAIVQLEHPEGYVPPVVETPAAPEKKGLFGFGKKKEEKKEEKKD